MKLTDLKSKYIFYLFAIGGLSFYLFATEIWDRYSDLFKLFDEYGIMEKQLSDIGNFESKKFELLQMKKLYTTEFNKLYKNTTQNDIDLFEYSTKLSKKNSVAITSVIPVTSRKIGYFNEVSYKMTMRGRYVNIGKLFTDLENGTIPIVLSKVEFKKTEQFKPEIVSTVELKAYIYRNEK